MSKSGDEGWQQYPAFAERNQDRRLPYINDFEGI
jgi:hypothetical protein